MKKLFATGVIVWGIIAGFVPGGHAADASTPPSNTVGTPFSTTKDKHFDVSNDELIKVKLGGADAVVQFPHGELTTDLMPFVINVMTVLIGAIAVVVFAYAGVNYIVRGDNEEEVGKSLKMILYGAIGVAIASLSYAIINNVLSIFT